MRHFLTRCEPSEESLRGSGRKTKIAPTFVLWLTLAVAPVAPAFAVTPQELLAHPPTNYFNDYAQVVTPAAAVALNHTLADFDRQTSNQIVMVIFPEWPADLVFDDYAQDLYRAAKIGRAQDNGVLVVLSIKESRIRIHTGRGLEGALPDALCIRIIYDNFTPEFRKKNYEESFKQGLAAIMAASKGEYKGNGLTVHQQKAQSSGAGTATLIVLFFLIIFICVVLFAISTIFYARRGGIRSYNRGSTGPEPGGGGFFFGGPGGGGFSDSGGSSSGGGGSDDSFSGGGGDSGGGGASGDMS
ncbi:MAG: TPM domain-containing protein [Verrucomicrobia bacterium]|nr:TPM domain-containing protein [Verrucomicrobiota bacterium]